ncbi:barwin-like endoglucanase, partial [Piromyces finnis]
MKKLIFITISRIKCIKNTAKDCFSLKLGYPCCSTTNTINAASPNMNVNNLNINNNNNAFNGWAFNPWNCKFQCYTNTKNPNTNNNNNINGNVNINNKINNNGNTNINKNNKPIFSRCIGGKSGVTTAYWDCCVASCSWDANVSGSKPVKACRKDGVSLVTEELWKVKSVCDNGDAYMCNDQQPIVINEKLSYGFAASHDPCCSCQRLQFTSGPIKGKQMIVQITNTGSDVGTNHFDIQIPGGGVGIFNGCSKQWGAPNDGWGRRYGGVTTKSECSQLPS